MVMVSPTTTSGILRTKNDIIHNPFFLCLRSYFSVCYYTGVFPCCPIYDEREGKWKTKTSKFQKIVGCLILVWIPFWVYRLLYQHIDIRDSYKSEPTAKSYFRSLLRIVILLKYSNVCWIITRRSTRIPELVNSIHGSHMQIQSASGSHISTYRTRYQRTARIGTALLLVPIGSLVIHSVFVFYDPTLRSMSAQYEQFIHKGRNLLFLEKMGTPANGYSNTDILVGVFYGWLRFVGASWIFLIIEVLLLGIFPLTFWITARNFEDYTNENLRISKDKNKETGIKAQTEVISAFEELNGYFCSLNSVWSTLNLLWLIDCVLRNILYLNSGVGTKSAVSILKRVSQMLTWFVSMYLSGDVYRRMECVRIRLTKWMNEFILDYGDTERTVLQMKGILLKLKDETMGIGTVGVYKYNFALIAQLLTVTITLFNISFDEAK